jgi:DNA-binding protein HU-beta
MRFTPSQYGFDTEPVSDQLLTALTGRAIRNHGRRGILPMNKAELVAKVAEGAGLTKADADKATDAVFAAITAALKSGEEVRLSGFATFSVSSRPARQGRNPRTGEVLTIPASKAPKFSAGKGLKDTING